MLYLSIGLAATFYAEKLPYDSYYRAADGLSSRSVNCISQDEAGFIWIGSENGLDRFDGHHFKHYDIADGRTIYTIYPDNRGKLRLGTGGAYSYSTRKTACPKNSTSKQNGQSQSARKRPSFPKYATKFSSGQQDRDSYYTILKMKNLNNSTNMHQ
ncbi:putative signal transduction histidine kinase [Bacteroides sp. CAG:770]|nr:putative signal transduction histidine kinase [Bacteroides sp. CAG:770]